jgi:hypothetical protein
MADRASGASHKVKQRRQAGRRVTDMRNGWQAATCQWIYGVFRKLQQEPLQGALEVHGRNSSRVAARPTRNLPTQSFGVGTLKKCYTVLPLSTTESLAGFNLQDANPTAKAKAPQVIRRTGPW